MRNTKSSTFLILVLILIFLSACNSVRNTPASALNTPVPVITTIQATPNPLKDTVVISKVESENDLEIIYVTNISNKDIDITGYTLFSPVNNLHINFPKMDLQPGTSYKIYNGPKGRQVSDGLFWQDKILLSKPGDYVVLLNYSGRAIWFFTR